ncbi:MAG: hypothetical protein V1824_03055 [archaeon]
MYLFILGRDFELSKLELVSFFKLSKINYKIIDANNKYLLIDIFSKIDIKQIGNKLCGISKICDVYYSSKDPKDDLINKLDFDYTRNFNFSVSSFDCDPDDLIDIINIIKNYYKSFKVKAVYKKPKIHNKGEENYVVNPVNYYSWRLDKTGFEIFVFRYNDLFYFAKTVFCFNSKQNMEIDNYISANNLGQIISFKLARMLINILGLENGKTIFDPFARSGEILIAGLYAGYDVIGYEKNNKSYDICKKNIDWAYKKLNLNKKFKLLNYDYSNISCNGVCFEGYLGPVFKKAINNSKALAIKNDLESLYLGVFTNLSRNLKKNTKVVCVLPYFKSFDGKVYTISEDIFIRNNFKLFDIRSINNNLNLNNPIMQLSKKGDLIFKKIYILEKM